MSEQINPLRAVAALPKLDAAWREAAEALRAEFADEDEAHACVDAEVAAYFLQNIRAALVELELGEAELAEQSCKKVYRRLNDEADAACKAFLGDEAKLARYRVIWGGARDLYRLNKGTLEKTFGEAMVEADALAALGAEGRAERARAWYALRDHGSLSVAVCEPLSGAVVALKRGRGSWLTLTGGPFGERGVCVEVDGGDVQQVAEMLLAGAILLQQREA